MINLAFTPRCICWVHNRGASVPLLAIYRADDAPLYRRGNRAIIGIIAWNFASAFLVKGYYMWRNKKRDQAWNALGAAEKDHYLATTTDEGSRRLDFRFAH
ncbi:hypothetical protein BN1723_016655, partial [Verticillium longisporum]